MNDIEFCFHVVTVMLRDNIHCSQNVTLMFLCLNFRHQLSPCSTSTIRQARCGQVACASRVRGRKLFN